MKFTAFERPCLVALSCLTLTLTVPALSQSEAAPPPGGTQDGANGAMHSGMNGEMHGGGMGRGQGVRGIVTAVSGKQITIKTEAGDLYEVTTGDNTRLMKDHAAAAMTDIHEGDMLFVAGQVDASARTVGAAMVAIVDAEQVRKMREDLGKTWIAGKVTAIDDRKITVLRMDGVSQTIAVDQNTSFRKRRDSITLADIKAGDPIRARGAVKDGLFVAREMNLSEGPMGMGRGPGGPHHGDAAHHDAPGQDAPGQTAPQP